MAIDCGAEYLGFNFYPGSPRYLTPESAGKIIQHLPSHIISVGIFVNAPSPQDVVGQLEASGCQFAQLHGDEDERYCRAVGVERVIRALRVHPGFASQTAVECPASAILLDAFDTRLYGGTGKTVNWQTAHEIAQKVRVFLAGGLSPDNIAEAIRIVRPFAVDVNSGVESSPGHKDAEKLQQLRRTIDSIP